MAARFIGRGSMLKGTSGVEVIDELEPVDGDIVIDSFSSSGFCIHRSILCCATRDHEHRASGIATHVAVESTSVTLSIWATRSTRWKTVAPARLRRSTIGVSEHLSFFGFVIDAAGYMAAIGGRRHRLVGRVSGVRWLW